MQNDSELRVCVIGLGYVGLPLAVLCAQAGHLVVGVDTDEAKVASIAAGLSYIGDVDPDDLAAVVDSGRFEAVADLTNVGGFDVTLIAVPTPLSGDTPDTSAIEHASALIGGYVRVGDLVVLESTSYPGTTERLVGGLIEERSGLRCGTDFSLGYSPERIDPGNADFDVATIPKIIAGVDRESADKMESFYSTIVGETVRATGIREAELAKLLENTFRTVNIALVNELAKSANDLGVDIWETIRLASTKPFGFSTFYPGPGVGGHCLPVDPRFLSWHIEEATGAGSEFIQLARQVNQSMPAYVVDRLANMLDARDLPLDGASVLLLGYAYKANTADVRESPAEYVARTLIERGAQVSVFDPLVDKALVLTEVTFLTADDVGQQTFDAAVLITDHDDVDAESIVASVPMVLDTRGTLTGDNIERL